MTLLNETTEIPPERSAAEIISKLVQAGARQINQRYGPLGKIEGVDFILEIKGRQFGYRLPARIEGVFQILQKRHDNRHRNTFAAKDRVRAERIAWRQLLRWVDAQLAMIQTGMLDSGQVFLPYLLLPDGRTTYDLFIEQQKLLPLPLQEAK